ncbi:hypothetical protein [Vulcaniibacterium gelatinicum]|uniref:hypothetical protein n=1 Tax=Vulcaniibacterium gelatinicum TaxID=2598725 RepID=UPI0011C7AFAB|nr:hypothetical protein [Vulcaniibacterium gelatinicum]
MRHAVPTPTDDPLPLAQPHASVNTGAAMPATAPPPVPLRDDAIAAFDALLHEIHPDAPRVDQARVQALCRWLVSLPPQAARDVLERRLRRLEELRAMLADPDWNTDPALAARVRKLLAYLDQDDDLIPDRQPLLGKLDDVLLLELAWPACAVEMEEYGDFRAYRQDEHPAGDGATRRAAWLRDRLAEIALWRHRLRVHTGHYAPSGATFSELFHVA